MSPIEDTSGGSSRPGLSVTSDPGNASAPDDSSGDSLTTLEVAVQQLQMSRSETRAEIGLLHDRVNALLAAEAFLTVGFAVTMSNGTAWGKTFALIVAPVLAVLGLLLAVFAGSGITATARLVLDWTSRQQQLLDEHPALSATVPGWAAGGGSRRQASEDQRRSLLFFRAVPVLFSVVWAVLTVVALTIEH